MTEHSAAAAAIRRCLVSILALTLPLAARAAGRLVTVEVDQQAYHSREVAFRLNLLKSRINAALAGPASSIRMAGNDREVSAYVTDLASNSGWFVDAAKRRFAGDPKYVFVDQPSETFRITYSQEAKKAFDVANSAQGPLAKVRHYSWSAPLDLSALQSYVLLLRSPLTGVDIEALQDGAIVRSDNAAFGSEMENDLRRRVGGAYRVTQLSSTSWRVGLDPSFAKSAGPGMRLELGVATQEVLRQELRDPVDLDTDVQGSGVDITVIEPDRHRSYVDALTRAFAGNSNFILQSQPSVVLRIALRETPTAAKSGPNGNPGTTRAPPLTDVFLELDELAMRPVDMSLRDEGLWVHAKDPSHNADRAAVIRLALADSPDIAISTESDQSLLISFNSDVPPMAPVGDDRLRQAVQARLSVLKLSAIKVSAIAPEKVGVEFSTYADAKTFSRDLSNGFAMRLVDEKASDSKPPPTSSGDERIPQREGGYLWLSSAPVITGDMIASASAEPDHGQGDAQVVFRLTDEGRKRFAAVTGANVNHAFAIVVDGVVVSAPIIREAITGGEVEISGDFTLEAANALARSLLSHRNDLPLRVVD